MNHKKLRTLIFAINLINLFVIFFAAFYPFEMKPSNKVYRLKNTDGVIIQRNGIIYEPDDEAVPGLLSHMSSKNTFAIEFAVKPYQATANRLSCILCFYDDIDPELLMIAKWKSELILRRRIAQPNGSYSYHEVSAPDLLFTDQNSFITILITQEGTSVYRDGMKKAYFPKYNLDHARQFFNNSHVILGNEPRVKVPWDGEVYGLAIYNCSLNDEEISKHYEIWKNRDHESLSNEKGLIALYPMNERSGTIIRNIITNRNNLVIPEILFALKKSVLTKPWIHFWLDKFFYYDILINILGFIPLGFFLLAYFVTHYQRYILKFYIITIFIGSIISFAIELIQVYMPGRTSSITDLVCNISGTILGVVIFHIIYKRYLLKTKKPV
jgi:hypothetical protein